MTRLTLSCKHPHVIKTKSISYIVKLWLKGYSLYFIVFSKPIDSGYSFERIQLEAVLMSTVQSRGFFTSPLTPADNFSKPPADPRTCPLSIPTRDTLIPPRIRRGLAVVPPDTYLIPPRIRGGLTMSNDDVIMIDS